MFLNIAFSTYSIIVLAYLNFNMVSPWSQAVYAILSSSAIALFGGLSFEFVCAQSPYNMRGLLTGYAFFTMFLFNVLGSLVSLAFCDSKICLIAQYSLGAGLGILGAVLQCVFIMWYKPRERDQQYDLYHQVASTYDRYLSREQDIRGETDPLNI